MSFDFLNDLELPDWLSEIIAEIDEQIAVIKERDPAAESTAEALLYPGMRAVLAHRYSHKLYLKGHRTAARMICEWARSTTGIEIHPGATLGQRIFIDHGMSVVIGETAAVGDDCTIYQGVTLGGTGKHTGKRHPTIGKNVMIGAGAKILGPVVIGDNARIAAGAVVLNDIPENSTAVGIPARIAKIGVKREGMQDLDQIHIPDPVLKDINDLKARIAELEAELAEVKKEAEKKDI